MSEFKCPFCKGVMGSVGDKMFCMNDGIELNLTSRSAKLHDNAPKYIQESQSFVHEVLKAKPIFALANAPLYSVDFTIAGSCMIGGAANGCKIKSVRSHTVGSVMRKYKHLLYAKDQLADCIIDKLRYGLEFNSMKNPLDIACPSASQHLYYKILVSSINNEYMNQSMYTTVHAYFQPTLEGMFNELHKIFIGADYPSLTEEKALYSYAVMEPHKNITWDASEYQLRNNIFDFIKKCIKDVAEVNSEEKIESTLQKKIVSEYTALYTKCTPHLAVNNQSGGERCTFNIMRNTAAIEVPNNLEFVQSQVISMSLLASMWDIYASKDQAHYGIEGKRAVLKRLNVSDELGTSNEIVKRFWIEVNKMLEGSNQ